jgi:predicted anti-sigma-YlaC factor YlaD
MKRTMKPMDCSTFRRNLAGRAAAGHLEVDVEMAAHAQQCPECRARLTAITALECAERMPVQTPAHLETRILAERLGHQRSSPHRSGR